MLSAKITGAGSATTRIGLVVNAASSGGGAQRIGGQVERLLADFGLNFVVLSGTSAAQTRNNLATHASTLSAVILVGGDGLISTFINTPEARHLPFGIIPAGSENDFSRHLGVNRSSAAATLSGILASLTQPRAVDVIVAQSETTPEAEPLWIAGGLSMGFDAAINASANGFRLLRGNTKYLLALLIEAIRYRPRDFHMIVNGQLSTFPGMLCTVMNINSLGGGINLVPDADACDGKLNLITVAEMSKLRFLALLPTLLTGAHVRRPEVRQHLVEEVTVGAQSVAYADGEHAGSGRFHLRVKPGALHVLNS